MLYNNMCLSVVCTVAVVVVVVLLALYMRSGSEDFTSKAEKAQSIFEWFRTSNPTYDDYRSAIEGDIVEYTDVTKLKRGGKFTVDNIEKII